MVVEVDKKAIAQRDYDNNLVDLPLPLEGVRGLLVDL